MEMDCSDTGGSSAKGHSTTFVSAGLRAALASGAAVALVLAALGAAAAAVEPKPQQLNPPQAKPQQPKAHQAKREQPKKPPPPKALDLPLIEVSISKQQLTVYEMGEPVAHAPVSTGMAGHSTPTGIFAVIGKEVFHRSNIYSGAPMPYMQRITWSGVALHAGVLPGYPASHGCIRMPHDFAVKLFGLTHMGARVLVMPHEVAPVPFESAKLFTRAKPATDKTSDVTLPVPGAVHIPQVHVIRTAESQSPSVMSDAVDTAAHALSGMAKPKPAPEAAAGTAEPTKVAQPAQVSEPPAAATRTDAAEPAKQADEKAASEPAADALKNAATTAATQATEEANKFSTAAGPAAASRTEQPVANGGNQTAAASGSGQNGGEGTTGTVMVKPIPVTSPQPIEVQKSFEPARGPTQGTQTFQPATAAPAAQPVQAAPAAVPATPAAQLAQPTPAAQPPATPEAKPTPAVAAADEFYGPERPMRPGPITVFVSKKEGKLFVRKGFQQVFSWPVKFEHPELPLGTHLYTAIDANPDGVSFRWQVVSVPVDTTKKAETRVTRDKKGHHVEKVAQPAVSLPPATAAEALERIDIPPVALTRISALMSKGAALIISDQGLGGETGTETDFIVLTR
jgi:lipoprotein-anchoring transpeptidase ErfK/SrfK